MGKPRTPLVRRVRKFAAERPDLCRVGFEEVPCDPGWALAYDEWATAREDEEAERRKAEEDARRKEAEQKRKRDAEFLEQERVRVEKWNRENAARSAREREEERNKIRAGYERRASELEEAEA